jgi:hypothetical protein
MNASDIVEKFFSALEEDLQTESTEMGEAAKETLEAGIPIYYIEDDIPKDLLIKHYPTGRRELVSINIELDHFGEETVVQVLSE